MFFNNLLYNFRWKGLMRVIIYVDVLILVNFIVDYFLLLLTSRVLKIKYKLFRLLSSAFISGLSSLYIFFENSNAFIDFFFKLFVAFLAVIIAFKLKSVKLYLKTYSVYFVLNFIFAGIVTFIYKSFSLHNVLVLNSVVYFNISALELVIFTVGFYFLFLLLRKIFKSSSYTAKKALVTVFYENKYIELPSIIDSGNSIEDIFSQSDVIIADKRDIFSLFGEVENNEKLASRFRIIPCVTVSGKDYLKGIRSDKAVVKTKEKNIVLEKPIIAESKTALNDDYRAILNPKIFEYIGE